MASRVGLLLWRGGITKTRRLPLAFQMRNYNRFPNEDEEEKYDYSGIPAHIVSPTPAFSHFKPNFHQISYFFFF